MEKVDLLIINANVLTLDGTNKVAGSLAVSDGKIRAIWRESEPSFSEVKFTPKTEVLDLKGATIIPGFIETHNHLLHAAYLKSNVDCSSPKHSNIKQLLNTIKEKIDQTPAGEWIVGNGYDDTMLAEKRHPTRFDLDQVSADNPVYITHISGHFAVVNSKALELAGITDEVAGNQTCFGRDEAGALNGVLYEAPGMMPLQKVLPVIDEKRFLEFLNEASEEYIAQGITTNTDAAISDEGYLSLVLKASELGIIPMRMQLMIMHTMLGEKGKYANYSASQLDEELKQRSNGRSRLDSAKMFQDGSIQGLTGALREPYFCDESNYGELFHEQTSFNEEVANLNSRGYRVATHGNGDRAIGSILEAYEYALAKDPRTDHRHRIEHVQTATEADLDKMAELNVAGSFFINHVYYWGQRHEKIFLGPKRAKRISPLKDAVKRNLLFTLHSDCPVTPISPLFLIWVAVNRLTREGDTLGAEQKIDVMTALRAMTIDGAKLNFQENDRGSIEVGKYADFAVLSEDPTQIDPLKIKDIEVLYTIIDGHVKYENNKVRV